jgi:hypothetical protein
MSGASAKRRSLATAIGFNAAGPCYAYEKSQIQALDRTQLGLPMKKGGPRR